ncbi:MAG: aminoglycoside phosphotransferase [Rickettsiaceae bacterium]|nr:aminoglycoside phosphotransferase [Rickettsiaceae bacterium]
MNELEKNNINLFGKRGKQWIQSLPKITESLSKKWQLTDIVPVENMSWNYVVKAHSKKHGPVCIKVSVDENLISDEIKALEYFNGFGMIKLIDHDTELHALLLRQAIPGKSLKDLYQSNKEEPIAIYASVIEALLSAPKGKINTKKHVKDWLKAFDRVPKNKLPNDLIHKAKILSKEMLEQPHDEFLLHGDLHMDNIISDQNEWIAIDPKGIIGPKEFEIACFDFITKDELSSVDNIPELFNARATELSRLLKIDNSILKNWVFIRLVLGACWMIEDNGKADLFLNQLQAIFLIC